MFEIDENSLPIVRTGQALLVIDLQNDFVATGGLLHVGTPHDFLENIINLVPHFRSSGKVIWIRSTFKESRPVNVHHVDSEKVITDKELLPSSKVARTPSKSRPSVSKTLLERHSKIAQANGSALDLASKLSVDEEEKDPDTEETFLTIEPGCKPQHVLDETSGNRFTDVVCQALDETKDTVFQKSHYSAFKDGTLVQRLRSQFVTEIYICGALSNISVFATAMDAARHGYSITIIEDCLGYRSKARHDEAMRQVTEFTGCDVINSIDLVESIRKSQSKSKSKTSIAPQIPDHSKPPPRRRKPSLEVLMSNLNIEKGAPRNTESLETSSSESQLLLDPSLDEDLVQKEAPPKRDRVKTKVKTRRRNPEAPREAKAPGISMDDGISSLSTMSTLTSFMMTGPGADAVPPRRQQYYQSQMATDKKVQLEKDSSEVPLSATERYHNVVNKPSAEIPTLCEGDTTVIENLLTDDLYENIFERVRDEVLWQRMSHQGGDVPRLVCVQGDIAEDGSFPIYRHPADESPPLLSFSPVVLQIRKEVEQQLGHPVNHVLIQFYRDGTDHITEHSDKTLDIVPNTFIANVSLGAQRTMVFRTKKQPGLEGESAEKRARKSTRAPLPHNSMCKMGLVTNMRWLHGIRQDKRLPREKADAELAYDGGRISLTFRLIGTFLNKEQQKIWGQGATSKSKEEANAVVNGYTTEAEAMLKAFGTENHSTEFDWEQNYGGGFDALHISNSPKLFLSGDPVSDLQVKIALNEFGIDWVEGKHSPAFKWTDGSLSPESPSFPENTPIKFVDNDINRSTITGDLAILHYLAATNNPNSPYSRTTLARIYTRVQLIDELLKKWRVLPFDVQAFRAEMASWDAFAQEAAFIAGDEISLADFVFFSILADLMRLCGKSGHGPKWEALEAYYKRMSERESVKKAMGVSTSEP